MTWKPGSEGFLYGSARHRRRFWNQSIPFRSLWYSDLVFSFDISIPNVAHLDPQRGWLLHRHAVFYRRTPRTARDHHSGLHVVSSAEQSVHRSLDACEDDPGKRTDLQASLCALITEPDTRAIYESLLEWLRDLLDQQALWFVLPSEVDSWRRARGQMLVIRDAWRIKGAGAERPVLAFTKDDHGRLTCEQA